MEIRILTLVLVFICLTSFINIYASDDITNTWVVTDGLGRQSPDNKEAGDVKKDKYVGIFYFLFLDTSYKGSRISDKSYVYSVGGTEALWDVLVRYGIDIFAEPYFGYYENQDEWVYRKHASMLVAAGVDFVFLDNTNPNMYAPAWNLLFKTWQAIRDEGGMTPQIIFHTGNDPDRTASHISTYMKEIYSREKYKDLWFMWEGKPLIFGNPEKLSDESKDFFTIRESWAFNHWTGDGIEKWPWIAEYPQVPGRNIDGLIEQVSVSAGFHASTSRGRSYVKGVQTSNGNKDFGYSLYETDYGLAFQEQWDHALELDPPLITVTGWNEFHNGGSSIDSLPNWTVADTYTTEIGDMQFGKVFVDCFSTEFSRDIEPISGYYGDNYYYQLCHNIRLFKGVAEIPKGRGSYDMGMDASLETWDKIGPSFNDFTGDVTHRDHQSVTGTYHYINNSGRNDIDYAKISKTKDKTYFFVSCKDDIIFDDYVNWMNLFIDTDQNHKTGFEGYDYILNRNRDDNTLSVEKFKHNSFELEEVGRAEYIVDGPRMVICVDNKLIKLKDSFDFKWADNSITDDNIMGFMDLGDSAPDGRFNFRYIKEGSKVQKNIDMNWTYVIYPAIAILLVGLIVLAFIKTKKPLVIIIPLVVIALGFALFFSFKLINNKNTIIIAVRQDISPTGDMEKMGECLDEFIEAFKKENKSINVKINYVKDFLEDTKADIFLISAENSLQAFSRGQAAPLNGYNINLDNIMGSAKNMAVIGDETYWLPFNYDRLTLLCDMEIFEELEVDLPNVDWTYDDFIKLLDDLYVKRGNKSYLGAYIPYHERFAWMTFVRGFAGDITVLTEGNSLKGLNSMFGLLNEGLCKGVNYNARGSEDAYAAMVFAYASEPEYNGIYHPFEKEIETNPAYRAQKGKLRILPLPTFPEGKTGAINTHFTHGFLLTESSSNKEKASKLIGFSQTVEGQRILNKYYGGIPTNLEAQKEDFWKRGLFEGVNSENILLGIENDKRDDFFEIFKESDKLYTNNLRMRVIFSSVLYQDFTHVRKGDGSGLSPEAIELLKKLEREIKHTIKFA